MLQIILLIALFIIEVGAFGWLIWEAKLGREKREQIIQLENQILKLEKVIILMEKTIIKKLDNINEFTKREKELLKNDKIIKQ